MKVLSRISAALVVAGALSACGPAGQQEQATPAVTPSVTTTPAVPEPAEFAGVITQMSPAGNCSLDVLNGVPVTSVLTVKKTDGVMLGGWMANSAGEVPTDARLVLQGVAKSYAFPVKGGAPRDDVAKIMKNEALKNAGFELSLGLAGAQAGSYDLAIVMGGDAYVCSLNTKLVISD